MTDDELRAFAADPFYVGIDGRREVSKRSVELLCAAIPRLLKEKADLLDLLAWIAQVCTDKYVAGAARAALEQGGT